jgi:hypothetical protein
MAARRQSDACGGITAGSAAPGVVGRITISGTGSKAGVGVGALPDVAPASDAAAVSAVAVLSDAAGLSTVAACSGTGVGAGAGGLSTFSNQRWLQRAHWTVRPANPIFCGSTA